MNNYYKKKYLKYKNKYYKLKGGASNNIVNKEYTIYTTGIAEWGKLDNMYKYWNETLCSKICNTIPLTFNIINIIHSDTFADIDENEKNPIEEEINKNLWNITNIDTRIKTILFQKDPLNFTEIKNQKLPYLIVDLAHIFAYTGITNKDPYGSTEVYIYGHYGEEKGENIFLNIFYPDYVGQEQPDSDLKITSRQIIEGKTNIIRIESDGYFLSIINILSNKERFKDFDNYYPLTKIKNMMKKIKLKIQSKYKEKYNGYDRFDIEFGIDNPCDEYCLNRYKYILELTINYIMQTDLEEESIIELIYMQYIWINFGI